MQSTSWRWGVGGVEELLESEIAATWTDEEPAPEANVFAVAHRVQPLCSLCDNSSDPRMNVLQRKKRSKLMAETRKILGPTRTGGEDRCEHDLRASTRSCRAHCATMLIETERPLDRRVDLESVREALAGFDGVRARATIFRRQQPLPDAARWMLVGEDEREGRPHSQRFRQRPTLTPNAGLRQLFVKGAVTNCCTGSPKR